MSTQNWLLSKETTALLVNAEISKSSKALYDQDVAQIMDTINKLAKLEEARRNAMSDFSRGPVHKRREGMVERIKERRQTRKVGDAILRPNGQVIETDPRDTLIATKHGMGGITVYIDTVMGVSAENISRALSKELGNKVRI